ncbi:helix-turn-helix domain-containing protein [Enterovibrio nigricans]|uniref:Helix-turn-helix n=1 Tax=Enterovibrio nigricans DSM 22720 TaxID=1121868 RepID=A0A1T4UR92_9GAMM|nr:helix-turn-helix domain-containing protein [Enterovibrio nigricans]SKA55163.1 Helix-turn-helix [Enterovibrio nigricans DSM 22720]
MQKANSKQEILLRVGKAIQKKRNHWPQDYFIRKHRLGISQATLSRWESGRQSPPLHVLVQLSIINIV